MERARRALAAAALARARGRAHAAATLGYPRIPRLGAAIPGRLRAALLCGLDAGQLPSVCLQPGAAANVACGTRPRVCRGNPRDDRGVSRPALVRARRGRSALA